MSPFETILLEEVARVKERLKEASISLSGFTLEIHASGRLDGDVEVSFAVSGLYGEQECKAGQVSAAVEEFMRRKGWTERHAPLCLPNVSAPASDEITY
jgi:hypothetical protein